MTDEESRQLAASILGPLLAADAPKSTPAEVAKRLFELATAIQNQAKPKAPPKHQMF